ncbi:ABC transporter substrate-binding protein [Lapidilactobacillus mulanensis]|uniref:ABC transporter substrate-binding protein n=1 Tax=Lapidilactobacillus mulanensis TaxID=2485999 RepID=A0ABW4DL47_9LACO|nr:ABC transporter substrate-binding protein [Lapidilactobacillus mulanensis]
MKKVGLILTAVLACLVLLGGCGKKTADADKDTTTNVKSSKKVTLDFWSFWGSGARREVIESIIKDYNESQDKVKIKYSYQPWGDIWTKSLSAITAGNPPDVIVQDINSVAQRADAKQATDITKYLDKGINKRFYSQLFKTTQYQNKTYGLPFNTDTQVIFYNKKIFKNAGLTDKDLPQTWSELDAVARTLDIKKDDTFTRIGFYPLWSLDTQVWALNADGGTSWFNDKNQVKIDTKNKRKALQWILDAQKYYGKKTINRLEAEFGSGVADPFLSGTVAMRAQNINYYTSIKENAPKDFEFGVIQLPEFQKGSGHKTWGGGFTLEVPTGAKHVKESVDFIKYLTSDKVQEKFGAASFDIMANKKANTNLINGKQLDETGQMIYKTADQAMSSTVLTPIPLSAPDYNNLVNEQIDAALLGQKSAKQALKDAQTAVENLVKQHK